MNRAKHEVIASIVRAKLQLDEALEDLSGLPMIDPMVLGFVAHAQANYLHVAAGTVELLQEELKDHPNRDLGIWLAGLKQVTERMSNLVDEMRTRPSKAVPQLAWEKVDLSVLVNRACGFYRRIAERKRIELLFEASAPPPRNVRTDRLAVAAVLDNLLSNAVKFSPPGKRVSVEVRDEAESVLCRVQDEGPGIRPQDRAALFQRGAQLEAKPTGGETSTGYGLAVAAELVAHLGGEIGCDSTPGQGACFFFRLPRSRVETPAPSATAP